MGESPVQLSVVIPVKDEQESIAALVVETHLALRDSGLAHEIIVVDDGSIDGTVAQLEQLASDPLVPLRVIVFEANAGQTAAMRAGCEAARAPWIGTLDGDGQNDPHDLPRLMEHAGRFDVVNGIRAKRRDSLWRKLCSRIGNGTRNLLTGKTVRDVGCSIRVFRRECLAAFPPYRGMHRFLPTLFTMAGFTITEIPVNHRPRKAGRTKYSAFGRMREGIPDLFAVRWMRKRARFPRIAREISSERGEGE
ncbi:glycosyltransferase family 2 protein [Candidatus Sumerlaeota bacterium]|nr:glycosyltransferase family 2 protein [Candidatus Sumerlaeota bacterium]